MTRINLLPWREMRRKEERRQFISIAAGAAILMGAIVFYIHIHVGGMLDEQERRNRFVQDEIAKVEEKIAEIRTLETRKQQLLARMSIIQQLQTRRPEIVRVFDEMARAVPPGMYLTRISQQGTVLEVEGMAQSNARVSAFMRNLDASQWFAGPRLEVIEANGNETSRASRFRLRVNQVGTGREDSQAAEAA